MKKIEKKLNRVVSGLARRATPSIQARPDDRAGPAQARFTTCRTGLNPCRVSSRPANPIHLNIYTSDAVPQPSYTGMRPCHKKTTEGLGRIRTLFSAG
jgi:hypothetical protein